MELCRPVNVLSGRALAPLLLTLAMLAASIPGWLLTPYGINFFDEPYQILNALDWQNAVYSPLSSRIANWFGLAADWKYLAFRRFAFSLNFLSLYVCALYALRHSRFKLGIIAFSTFSAFGFLNPTSIFNIYGWDSWTLISVALSVVAALSLFRNFTPGKALLLGVLAGSTALMRITNVSIIVFCPIIVFLAARQASRRPPLAISMASLTVAILTAGAILTALYGSPANYLHYLHANQISDHSPRQIISPLASWMFIALLFGAVYFAGFKLLKRTDKSATVLKWSVGFLLLILFAIILIPRPQDSLLRIQTGVQGLIFLSYAFLLRNRELRKRWLPVLVSIFLLALVPAIGSNSGFRKLFCWELVPIMVLFIGKGFTPLMKRLCLIWAVVFLLFYAYNFTRRSFFDEKFSELTFRFGKEDGVLEGMITHRARGEQLSAINRELQPYIEAGYRVLPLKANIDYIWEYMTLTRNPYDRHRFSSWYAFWDPFYVMEVMDDVGAANAAQRKGKSERVGNGSEKVLVMYMQWRDTVHTVPMQHMLDTRLRCVLDKPGYSFYVNHPTPGPYD